MSSDPHAGVVVLKPHPASGRHIAAEPARATLTRRHTIRSECPIGFVGASRSAVRARSTVAATERLPTLAPLPPRWLVDHLISSFAPKLGRPRHDPLLRPPRSHVGSV